MALDFNATSDRVTVTASSSLNNHDVGTYMLWVKFDTLRTGLGVMMQKGLAGARRIWSQNGNVGVDGFSFSLGRATTTLTIETDKDNYTAFGTGKWLFLVLLFNASGVAGDQRILIGDLTTPAADPSAYTTQILGAGASGDNSADNLSIGNHPSSNLAIDGQIAWAAQYNSYLTDAQIEAHRMALSGAMFTGCKLFAHLGFNGTGTQPDWSGNANNGTVSGATVAAHVPISIFPYPVYQGEPPSAITQAIGLETESDTPQALSGSKTLAIGLATETDTPLSMSVLKTVAVGLATETDTPLGMSTGGGVAIGLATETDTPLSVAGAKTKAIGLATETDTPLAMTVAKSKMLGLLTETDTPLSATALKTLVLGLLTETDTPLSISVLAAALVAWTLATRSTAWTLDDRSVALTLDDRSTAWTLNSRTGFTLPDLIGLQDASGYWQFEDGEIVAWSGDSGTALTLKTRSLAWTLKDK